MAAAAAAAAAEAAVVLREQRARGINGENSTFAGFEQVAKPSYRLTESAEDEFDPEFTFEVLHDPCPAPAPAKRAPL